jgi:hypothetical protein
LKVMTGWQYSIQTMYQASSKVSKVRVVIAEIGENVCSCSQRNA